MNIKRQEEQIQSQKQKEMELKQQRALQAAQKGGQVQKPTSNDLTIQMGDRKVLIPNITEQGDE